jgi:hypothetical protein
VSEQLELERVLGNVFAAKMKAMMAPHSRGGQQGLLLYNMRHTSAKRYEADAK